jgi:hypothetical protein
MNKKLVTLLIGLFLAGNTAVAFAGPGKNRGHDRPRAEHSQQRHYDDKHWRKDRIHSRARHQARRDDHGQQWKKGGRHGRPHARSRHRAPHARDRGHYKQRHGHRRSHYRHAPRNSLSIILRGHF